MTWPIRYHAERPENVQVGDMWPAPWLVRDGQPSEFFLSDAYIASRAWERGRLPLIVRLPDRSDFCLDGPAWENGNRRAGGCWTVSGEPPRITVTPSINIFGWYHGWITDGVITDDCEGRQFP